MVLRSSTLEIFGTRMPSGRALPAMATSSIHHGESSALTRISTSRLPKPLGGDGGGDLVARHRLGVGRHRILEIEDDAVGVADCGLFPAPAHSIPA